MTWRRAIIDPPMRGQYIEVRNERSPNGESDCVYWHPENGNWPLSELWWRPATDPNELRQAWRYFNRLQ
jgi:hypothetical protein